ncbi:hypothetical protein Cgig2_011804 [Carnegiea gigantea]|uniref:Protein yippee-like n=1 Tax=Carnegiea gigantea TaxID=171969 RepID=A0A9Q1GRE4_9CARY|nr:hypothetical protein Cgig2_011804 [Carnegiea gigantea]
MGRIFVIELEGRTYKCKFCKIQLALADDLVSQKYEMVGYIVFLSSVALSYSTNCLKMDSAKAFHCRRGKAYLFNKAVNITLGASEERLMLSGMHTVADIYCCCCGQIVGWKYEAAHEKSQKYKEGKFVLERGRIVDGLDTEFYIDARPVSDAEDA